MDEYEVCIVGGGVAGLTAGTFTARAGLGTVVVDADGSILRRNAHLENFPGFPRGVDARRLLERTHTQADRAGVTFVDGRVTSVDRSTQDADFEITIAAHAASRSDTESARASETDAESVRGSETDAESPSGAGSLSIAAERVIAASWSDASYLPASVATESRGSKTVVDVDRDGRTTVAGVYAAGRIADQYHQAVVCAGHGATVGVTVIHDSDVEFYHDWVVPDGYFTDRGRPVPPGCEEIDDVDRRDRDRAARDANAAYTVELDDEPTPHPSLVDDD